VTGQEPTVLVVGHDPDRPALRAALADGEFDPSIVAVADLPGALDALERHRVDCVVSAYEVPDASGRTFMGGLTLLEAVRSEHGDVPFVLLSDVVNEDSLRRAADLGVRAYVRDRASENVVEQLRYHLDSALRGRLAERRAAEQDRINELMRRVTQTLVLEQERDAMLRALCGELTGADIYRYAAYHRRAEPGVQAEPETAAGDVTQEPGRSSLAERCLQEGTLLADRLAGDDGSPEARAMRVGVPIAYETDRYGVLVLETAPGHGFFDTERAVLAELGEAIGHALDAIETREALREREADLQRRTEQLEEFASLVSHDIRNPLNVAQGYVDVLSTRTDDEAVAEVATSLDRIETIVEDILALTRAGQSIERSPTALSAVVEDAWASVDTGGTEAESRATLDVGSLPRVSADASQLQRVFENLFRNSIEHGLPADATAGEASGQAITISVRYEAGDLVVEDDGVGFPEGATEALFELGETSGESGTGIGLAIVADLLAEHGWSITAEDREAGGARFRIQGIEPLE